MTASTARGWPWLCDGEPVPHLAGFRPVIGGRGMVTSPHHLASQIGLDVLKSGGNAVDAAIATSAAIMVTCPMQCGPGGDAFWLIREPTGALRVLDASGRAPMAVDAADLRARGLTAIPKRSGLSVSVPGAVSGWAEAAARYGSRPLTELIELAAGLAAEGFYVSRHLAASFLVVEGELRAKNALALYASDDRPPALLSRLRQPQLAATLREIGRTNGRALYEGPLARAVVEACRRHGGVLAPLDLSQHRADWLEPIASPFRDLQICTSGPSTQGFALLFALRFIEMLEPERISIETPHAVHLMVEALAAALHERDLRLGDRSQMEPQLQDLWSDEAVVAQARNFNEHCAGLPRLPPPVAGATKGDTAHLAVVDSDGLAVSLIQSVFFDFGSCIPVPEGGFTLQNRGAGFSLVPGAPSELAPGRRPPHTLMPTIATRGGELALVLGCMGGDGQVQTQTQLILDLTDGGLDPQQAVSRPRWYLDRSDLPRLPVLVEGGIAAEIVVGLRERAHEVEQLGPSQDIMGHAQVIAVMGDGALVGAADPRSDGQVTAY